jgi:hypothetical protein
MHCQSLPDRPEYSFFTCAVAFLESVLKEHIIKGHNEFGVILWGTQENANSLGSTAGIVEWLPLSRPTCARIIQLGKLAAAGMLCAGANQLSQISRSLSGDPDALQVHAHYRAASAALPGSRSPASPPLSFTSSSADCDVHASSAVSRDSRGFSMNDALWCARKGFDKSSVRDGSKKIVVITCDACPCGAMTEDDESRWVHTGSCLACRHFTRLSSSDVNVTISYRMKRLVRDIADANISVTCMPITCAPAFDLDTFWRMVMTIDNVNVGLS